jgi:uncharacterized protein (TIGR02145 family)
MKKVGLNLSAVLITMVIISCGYSGSKVITIGNQEWMIQNLNVDKFRNGDAIQEAKTAEQWTKAGENGQPAWCYYDNDPANGKTYGKLYNWFAINDPRGLAPEGFHIPSDAEWTILEEYLGQDAGKKMKSTSAWNGTNSIGFSAIPGGSRTNYGIFYNIGYFGLWWSSSELDTYDAWFRFLNFSNSYLVRYDFNKTNGFSVRCIKD